jgi:hypothetical protein
MSKTIWLVGGSAIESSEIRAQVVEILQNVVQISFFKMKLIIQDLKERQIPYQSNRNRVLNYRDA